MKTIVKNIKRRAALVTQSCWLLVASSITLPSRLFAAIVNPWAGTVSVTPDNLQTTVDTKASNSLEVILLVIGVALFIAGISVFIHVLNKSADDKKEEGPLKSLVVMLVAVLGVIIGIILVAMAFTGAKALGTG